mgnify:CR=1 FL=1
MMNLSERYDKIFNKNFANNEFDIFISGSDILWDLNLLKEILLIFLDFVDSDRKKLLSVHQLEINGMEKFRNC